jgi:hypothetical protein
MSQKKFCQIVHSKEATTPNTPMTTAAKAPLICGRAALLLEFVGGLEALGRAALVELPPLMIGPPPGAAPVGGAPVGGAPLGGAPVGGAPVGGAPVELGGAPGAEEPGGGLPAGGGASPLAMAWNCSKVLSGGGLIAPTIPALQWLAGLVCGQ